MADSDVLPDEDDDVDGLQLPEKDFAVGAVNPDVWPAG